MATPRVAYSGPKFYEAFCLSCAQPVEIKAKRRRRVSKPVDTNALTQAARQAILNGKLIPITVYAKRPKKKKQHYADKAFTLAERQKMREELAAAQAIRPKRIDKRRYSISPDRAESRTG